MALQFQMEPALRREPSRADSTGTWRIGFWPDEPPAYLDDGPSQAILRLDTVAAAARADDLVALWQDLIDRRQFLFSEGASLGRRHVLARSNADGGPRGAPLTRLETAVVSRVLSGEQQKLIAAELGIACSTASKWYTQALSKLRLSRPPIPLPLIIAAQAWASGEPSPVAVRSATYHHAGCRVVLLSVPRPTIAETSLTAAEREVAKLLIEGATRWEIALQRNTSAQTVACQLRGIFTKFRLTGRYALVRRAVDLGWFR